MAKKTTKPAPKPATPEYKLPPDVVLADLKWGSSFPRAALLREGELDDLPMTLTFYYIPAGRKAPEWVLTTLLISRAGRGSSVTDRYYSIGVADSKVYTVGRGPHVVAEITVYLSKDNIDRLRKYVDLWRKGMAEAGQIRDRISSRRAQGQVHRAAGRTFWSWDS